MTSAPIVATNDLTKRFGRQVAVEGVSLSVQRGDVYGFLGLNGAGKTTSLRMILGLLKPTRGSVTLFGREGPGGLRSALGRIGALVENPAFFDHLTGAQNLTMLGSLSSPTTRQRVEEVLRQVGLEDAAEKKARDYSLGMKQRLAIGLALISRPELVVLDEPTNGLDPNGILEMRRLIRKLNAEDGVTFLISSHLLHEVEMVCSRVAILEQGRLVLEETLAELNTAMHNHFTLHAEPAREAHRLLADRQDVCGLEEPDTEGAIRFRVESIALPDLNRAFAAAGIDVFTLCENRMTLEELFLERSAAHTRGMLS